MLDKNYLSPNNPNEMTTSSLFTAEEIQRYACHLKMPEIGHDGQYALKQARVLIVGAGGLGTVASQHLAATGIGTIGLVDGDIIDSSNLQRQVLYAPDDIGKNKTMVAAHCLHKRYPLTEINEYTYFLNSNNAIDICTGYDLILDCADNENTSKLIGKISKNTGIPMIYGSIRNWEGIVGVFTPISGPCYFCYASNTRSTHHHENRGIFSMTPALTAVIQAVETIHVILNKQVKTNSTPHLTGCASTHMHLISTNPISVKTVSLVRLANCPVCS